jgi:hypothetical protein
MDHNESVRKFEDLMIKEADHALQGFKFQLPPPRAKPTASAMPARVNLEQALSSLIQEFHLRAPEVR